MRTRQELFEIVARGLIAQGEPSYDPVRIGGECRYRMTTPDGRVLRCAVGQLIPDETYDVRFEGDSFLLGLPESVRRIALGVTDDMSPLDYTTVDFVARLQLIHDQTAINSNREPQPWLTRWAWAMRKLADELGLDPPVLGGLGLAGDG